MSLAEMTTNSADEGKCDPPDHEHHHPKFYVDIECRIHHWTVSTITTEQIAELGGWEVSAGVIEIDNGNNERTLQPGQVVHLEPGMSFSKKVRWKRG
jgi:hypothetical protein